MESRKRHSLVTDGWMGGRGRGGRGREVSGEGWGEGRGGRGEGRDRAVQGEVGLREEGAGEAGREEGLLAP